MRLPLPIIVATMLLSGCQTDADDFGSDAKATAISGPAASAIAGDMASRLAEQVGAAGTTIQMQKDTSEFATALEAALKGWGYSVITDQKAEKDVKPVELAYSIDSAEGQVLARLSTPSIALGRAYAVSAIGATPASPLSIMQRN
jgi:hypothetical protein